jgi:hypothetical protein
MFDVAIGVSRVMQRANRYVSMGKLQLGRRALPKRTEPHKGVLGDVSPLTTREFRRVFEGGYS